jgi:O-acetyl-ADP-ribose deacetylase (regulator of RNase III)
MGQYKEIDGDLIKMFQNGEFDVIAHGCNCFATMGAGIALTVGKQFPEAKLADEQLAIPNGRQRLGKLSYTEIETTKNKRWENPLLFNLYTQYNPGPDFRMKAFISSIRAMKRTIKSEMVYMNDDKKIVWEPSNIRIGLPLIGCGIAGGDWGEVSEVIKNELSEFDVTIIHFKQKVVGVNYWPSPKPKYRSFEENEKIKKQPNKKSLHHHPSYVLTDEDDEEIVQYFKDTQGVDISKMSEKELDKFLDSI